MVDRRVQLEELTRLFTCDVSVNSLLAQVIREVLSFGELGVYESYVARPWRPAVSSGAPQPIGVRLEGYTASDTTFLRHRQCWQYVEVLRIVHHESARAVLRARGSELYVEPGAALVDAPHASSADAVVHFLTLWQNHYVMAQELGAVVLPTSGVFAVV